MASLLSAALIDADARARLTAGAAQARRDLTYLGVGLLTSLLALVVWSVGVVLTLSVSLIVIGLPLVLVSATAFRWVAEFDRRNAARELGVPLVGRYASRDQERLLARVSETLGDRQARRDLAWLVVHSVVGMTFGAIAVFW